MKLLLLSCTLILTSLPSSAQKPAETQAQPEPGSRTVVRVVEIQRPNQPSTAPSDALIAVRDAETGELRAPTTEERAQLHVSTDPLNRSDAGLEEIYYSDGTVGVRLNGRFQTASMIRRLPVGTVEMPHAEHEFSCTQSAVELVELVAEPAGTSQNREDR